MAETVYNPFTNKPDYVGSGGGGLTSVTAAGTLTDNSLIRGDGGVRGVQDSGISVDDSDNITGVGSISAGSLLLTTDLAITEGGTGRGTATAYAVLCGGTTATGAHQSIASVGTANQVLTSNGAGALPTFQAAATLPIKWIPIPGSALQPVETASGVHTAITGTNVKKFTRAFENGDFGNFITMVPDDIDTSANVTIKVYCWAATAAASKNVSYDFHYNAINDSEDWDVAYSTSASGDKSIDATQDDISVHSWTFAASGLSANDMLQCQIERTTATDDLVGDLYVDMIAIGFPRA